MRRRRRVTTVDARRTPGVCFKPCCPSGAHNTPFPYITPSLPHSLRLPLLPPSFFPPSFPSSVTPSLSLCSTTSVYNSACPPIRPPPLPALVPKNAHPPPSSEMSPATQDTAPTPSAPPFATSASTSGERPAAVSSAASLPLPLPTTNTIPGLSHDAVVARNGRGMNSPIELMVFGLPHHHMTTAKEVLYRALQSINLPNIDPTTLKLTAGPAGAEDGGRPSSVRISWSGNAWYESLERPIDLMAEMENVRTQLSKRFCAQWASAPGVDQRCHGRFQLDAQEEGIQINANDAMEWARIFELCPTLPSSVGSLLKRKN